MQALGRTLRKGVQLQPRLAEAACRVTTSAASESPAAASAASSQKGAVSREFQVQSHHVQTEHATYGISAGYDSL